MFPSHDLTFKSRQRLFSGDFDIFAYVGIESEAIAKTISDELIELNIFGQTLYVPKVMEYEFSPDFSADFGRQFINSRANLLFPGSAFRNYNLFPLLNTSAAAIIFYNRSLSEISDETLTPEEGDYYVTWLGDPDGRKPFDRDWETNYSF